MMMLCAGTVIGVVLGVLIVGIHADGKGECICSDCRKARWYAGGE